MVPFIESVPSLTVVNPVLLLAPLNVNTPAPIFVSEPPYPVMGPLKAVLSPSPPTVSWLAPSWIVPAPASEPMNVPSGK